MQGLARCIALNAQRSIGVLACELVAVLRDRFPFENRSYAICLGLAVVDLMCRIESKCPSDLRTDRESLRQRRLLYVSIADVSSKTINCRICVRSRCKDHERNDCKK